MAKKKSAKAKKRGKYFTIFILLIFIGSIIGFAMFSKPNTTNDDGTRTFLDQNIFETPIEEDIQRDVLLIENPNKYPQMPIDRVVGGIWIEHNCTACLDLITNLTRIVQRYYPRVYLSPDTNNTAKITLMSWAETEELTQFNETKIEDFICSRLILTPDICALRTL